MAKTPRNRNFLQINGFEFVLQKTPSLEFFVQGVTIPSITLPDVRIPNPLIDIKEQGEIGSFSDLEVVFIADEDLKTWEELFTWFSEVAFPIDSKQRKSRSEIFSDITIVVQTSHHNSNFQYKFTDTFPNNVSTLSLRVTDQDVQFLTFSATFSFTNILFDRIRK